MKTLEGSLSVCIEIIHPVPLYMDPAAPPVTGRVQDDVGVFCTLSKRLETL